MKEFKNEINYLTKVNEQYQDIVMQLENELLNLQKNYTKEISKLKDELYYYKNNPIWRFDFNSFVKMMKTEYSIDTMPSTSGIYVYINKKEELIYVGQSVNMKRRLQQHFRNGKVKFEGHDSDFKNINEWSFYVAEYINKNDKKLLNDRESFWIALAKHSTLNKKVTIKENFKKFEAILKSNPTKITKNLQLYKIVEEKGKVANKTNGNRKK